MTNVDCRLTIGGFASLNRFKKTVRQKTLNRQNTFFDAYSPPEEDSAFIGYFFDRTGRSWSTALTPET